MSVQLKQARNWKKIGLTSAVVIGASLVVLKTFPHVRSTIYGYISGSKGKDDEQDDNAPIELTEEDAVIEETPVNDIADESVVDLNEWSADDLKTWLKKARI